MQWRRVEAARELLAGERGAIVRDWGGQLPIVLAYPHSYAVGMSSLAMHALYGWLNARPGIVCERAFASLDGRPSPGEPVFTLESQRPMGDAAVIAFSVSFEMDYFHVLDMLRRSGVPVAAAERGPGDPLVLMGGPAVSANPLPLALVADAIVLGEVEPILDDLLRRLEGVWDAEREATLSSLAQVPGVYVPTLHQGQAVERQWLSDLDAYPVGSTIVAPRSAFGDMQLIEISRGCVWGCKFCLAGCWYRPWRERSVEVILRQAREGMVYWNKVGLVASAVSDYTRIDELTAALRALGLKVSVSSLRVRPLSEKLVQALAESGARTFTLAPEAGSDRLRQKIQKGVRHEDVIRAVALAGRYRFESLKLYFMWGLPGERDEDIEAIADLVNAVLELFPRQVVVNLTPFVPKAHTPFQREAMASTEVLEDRLDRLRRRLRRTRTQLRAEAVEEARIQALLARGDHHVSQALLTLQKPSPRLLEPALRRMGIDPAVYRGARGADERLPWEFIRL
ncbi:MAG: radical SAM protein [Chloroflexi bacterium]|nr:radical SAM protein [Chloroflexota bacterium]